MLARHLFDHFVERRPSPADGPRALPLATQAERCLRGSPYLALRNVACDGREGVLVLSGCLPSYYLKQLAQATVTHLEGVKQVVNHIEVMTAPQSAVCR